MIRLSEYLPSIKPASDAELDAFAKRCKGLMIRDFIDDRHHGWVLWKGDLLVPCDLYNDLSLIVTGSLIVQGTYDDYVEHHTGSVVCFGDMWADNIFSWGSIFVEGDLLVDGVVHTVYNDYSFEVKGMVIARAILVDDKATNDPKYSAEVWANSHDDEEAFAKALKKCKKLFPALTFEGGLEPALDELYDDRLPDFDRMRAHLYGGHEIFVKAKPKAKKADEEIMRVLLSRKEAAVKRAAEVSPVVAKSKLKKVPNKLRSLDEYRKEDEELVAKVKNPPPEPAPNFDELERILNSGTADQKIEVAQAAMQNYWPFDEHPKLRDQTLERLMLDNTARVRHTASCAWLSQKFFDEHEQKFMQDSVDDMRFVLALRTRNAATLRKLSEDASSEVRCATLMNPNCPEDLLMSVANSIDPKKQSEEEIYEIQAGFIQNMTLPGQMVAVVYKKQPNKFLAAHSNAPFEIVIAELRDQFKDSEKKVVEKLSACKTSDEAFKCMAESKFLPMIAAAAGNRHTPQDVLKKIYKDHVESDAIRCALARNPALPREIIEELAQDIGYVRQCLGGNFGCPKDILCRLAVEDENFNVRAAARLTLQKLCGEDYY